MRILFVHQNMPGQYKHLAPYLAKQGHDVVFLTQRDDRELPGVTRVTYAPKREPGKDTHRFLRQLESGVINAQAVAEALIRLHREQGWQPDLMVGHCGWGETLYLKDLYPDVPLVSYFEFYFHPTGADVDFDPSKPPDLNAYTRIRTRNSLFLLSLEATDWGVTPTRWQWQQHPFEYRDRISVIHEGVDTDTLQPVDHFSLNLGEDKPTLTQDDEVITYVARNLEPYRGFPTFMRAVERLARRRPEAHFLIIGGDEVSYGTRPQGEETYREHMLAEVDIDPERVHFLGRVAYKHYLSVLKVASAHVYLTYPFVLSWSLLEAMALAKPIVGSATAPLEEVITHGENGLLADFFDPEDVCGQVERLLDHPEEAAALGARARETVQRDYDLQRVCLPRQIKLLEGVKAGLMGPGPPC